MQKHKITIEDDLYNDLYEFCKLNNLNISKLCNEFIKKELLIEKYGDTPFTNYKNEIKEITNTMGENHSLYDESFIVQNNEEFNAENTNCLSSNRNGYMQIAKKRKLK